MFAFLHDLMSLKTIQRPNFANFAENRVILFLLFFLAMGAIALSIWQGVSFFQEKKSQAILRQRVITSTLANFEQQASSKLGGNITALTLIANSPALIHYVSKRDGPIEGPQSLLQTLLAWSPNVYQARYLDINGAEIIRVDKVAGEIKIATNLQDKSKRDYFVETIKLDKGQIYVSDLDLNVEHDTVVEPWLPTIRIATPVFNLSAKKVGVVVINIDATALLNVYQLANRSRVNIMLVNDAGYWLLGRPREQLWNFMFNKHSKFDDDFPAVWTKIKSGDEQNFRIESNGWNYLASTVQSIFPTTSKHHNPNKVLWHTIVQSPPQSLAITAAGFVPTLVILVALTAFSWAWAKSVTDKKRTEEELVKSEKMSSLGGLVAGVSHELNTPIGSAVTIASTLQDQTDELRREIATGQLRKSQIVQFVEDVRQAATLILRGLNRANELIGHFKQVAVDQSGEQRRQFNLDEYIREMAATFNHLFKYRQVELELGLTSNKVLDTFPGALSQVIINLVQNALLHGFANDEPGIIRITSRALEENSVQLEIFDNGAGINPAIIRRVFDPFFTTKLGQGGSGLGLHIVHNIVTNVLGGTITVTSDPGNRSTQFTLIFPCVSHNRDQQFHDGESYAHSKAA